MAALEQYETAWKIKDNKYKNPRLFGLHWHNVFLILVTILVAALALFQTIKTASTAQPSGVDIAETVVLWFTTFAAVGLLVRFVQFNPLHLFVKPLNGEDSYLNLGLYPDPIDIDTTDLSRALLFGEDSGRSAGYPSRASVENSIGGDSTES